MIFTKINYLEWARRYMGSVRYDLARSNLKPLTRDELDLSGDAVDVRRMDSLGHPGLRKLLAARYGVSPERVFITNGATMGIYLACAATLLAAEEVLLEAPNYEPLYRVPLHLGAEVKTIERRFEHGWQIDLEALERRVSRRTKVLLMTNFHNPSGVATNPDKMLTLGQIARDHGARVIVSEVSLDNAFSPGHKPAVRYGDHMISIGSVSKVYGLDGLRIGWVVAPESIVERIAQIQDYISGGISAPSQSLALAVLAKADTLLDRSRRIVQENLKILGEWIRRREGCGWVEPEGGTVAVVRLPPKIDAVDLSNYLREKHGTLVVPGDYFWLRGFIRISLGVEADLLRTGLKHLGSALDHFQRPLR
ncbi:MAG: aminotransferase class I/II-fold pyridoxal phosphate-dependent enzyme [Planctomycetes bacterium]|nr:aminotransferase class I/II-fold pyridoxal phosphate-dependent enzyme [Planctomycetota bacterium]